VESAQMLEQQLSPPLKALRLLLTLCFIVTMGHKINGNKIALILMPCHMATGKKRKIITTHSSI